MAIQLIKAIGQSQSSNQGSGVVSGGNTAGSGNNANTQSQTNTGNNAAAQQGGSGKWWQFRPIKA